jgi:hypothetical protein
MPDQEQFPAIPPVKGPPPAVLPRPDSLREVSSVVSPLNVYYAQKKVLGKAGKMIDEHIFDDKVIDPLKEAAEDFLEEKLEKMPIKKVTGGAGLFIIEHTIISHSGHGADPTQLTVVRPNGTTYTLPDLGIRPPVLPPGDRFLSKPGVAPGNGSDRSIVGDFRTAVGPLTEDVSEGSLKPGGIRPVNAKAIDNENRATGIRRELVTERADP